MREPSSIFYHKIMCAFWPPCNPPDNGPGSKACKWKEISCLKNWSKKYHEDPPLLTKFHNHISSPMNENISEWKKKILKIRFSLSQGWQNWLGQLIQSWNGKVFFCWVPLPIFHSMNLRQTTRKIRNQKRESSKSKFLGVLKWQKKDYESTLNQLKV